MGAGVFEGHLRRPFPARERGANWEFQNLRASRYAPWRSSHRRQAELGLRQLVTLPTPNSQELWEEMITRVTVTHPYQRDMETTMSRDTRTTGGTAVGERSTAAPPVQAGPLTVAAVRISRETAMLNQATAENC